MKYPPMRKSRGSVAGMVIVGIGCAAILVTLAFIGFFQLTKGSSRLGRAAQTSALLAQAAHMLIIESADSDKDGYWEAPVMDSSSGQFPSGGGRLPATSAAPKNDGWGTPIGYCSWDIGESNTSTSRIAGTTAPNQATTVFAVISAGNDKAFNTTCADILAGSVKGDDRVLKYSNSQIVRGVGGSRYFGDAVASSVSLAGLTSSADGEVRLQKDTNKLVRWDASTASWIAITSGAAGGSSSASSLGLNNQLINGNFILWQRADPDTVDLNTSARASPYIYADRWLINGSGTARNGSYSVGSYYAKRIRPGAGAPQTAMYGMEVARTSSTQNGALETEVLAQRIDDVSTLNGNYLSYSFWVKVVSVDNIANQPINFCADIVLVYQATAGAPWTVTRNLDQRCYTATNTWQKIAFIASAPLPSINMSAIVPNTFSIWFRPITEPAGAAHPKFVAQVTQAQLETGQVVSPFEERPPGLEMLLAQRYYETGSATARFAKNGRRSYMSVYYKVRKRYVSLPAVPPLPTVSPLSGDGGNCGPLTADYYNEDMFQFYMAAITAPGCNWDGIWSVDAEDYS